MKSNRSGATKRRKRRSSTKTTTPIEATSNVAENLEQQPSVDNNRNNTINEILILDNGGYAIKHITIPIIKKASKQQTATTSDYKSTPNCTATLPHQVALLVGDEIETKIQNKSQCVVQYPLERGYITDLGTQLRVWDRIMNTSTSSNSNIALSDSGSKTNSSANNSNNCAVLLLTQPFTPKVISTNVDYALYKDLNVSKVSKRLGACVAARYYIKQQNNNNKCCLIIDSGFSMTNIIPTYNGYAISKGIKRINIGGKVLTNVLKQYISYRQWNMMDDFYIVNEIKEKSCFVMKNENEFYNTMKNTKNLHKSNIVKQYVLPDFVSTFEGYVINQHDNDEMHNNTNNDRQIVTISTERYSIPELLFHPSDIGIQQMGLSQTIAQSISLVDIQYQSSLWSNILFIGGNAKFIGIKERLERELRSLAPDYIENVNVIIPDDPIGYIVHAAEDMVKCDTEIFLKEFCLDVRDWEEAGTEKNDNGVSCEDDIWEKIYYNSESHDEDMVLL